MTHALGSSCTESLLSTNVQVDTTIDSRYRPGLRLSRVFHLHQACMDHPLEVARQRLEVDCPRIVAGDSVSLSWTVETASDGRPPDPGQVTGLLFRTLDDFRPCADQCSDSLKNPSTFCLSLKTPVSCPRFSGVGCGWSGYSLPSQLWRKKPYGPE